MRNILGLFALLLAVTSVSAQGLDYDKANKLAMAADMPLVVYRGWIVQDLPGAIVCQVGNRDPQFDGFSHYCAIISVRGQWVRTLKESDGMTLESIKAAIPKKVMTDCETGKCRMEWNCFVEKPTQNIQKTITRAPQGHTHTCSSCGTTWDHVSNPVGPGKQGHTCPTCKAEQWTQDGSPRPVTIKAVSTGASAANCTTGNCPTGSVGSRGISRP